MGDAGYIGEELFDDPEYELERTCKIIKMCIENHDLTLEVALEAYGVSEKDYLNCIQNL